MKTTAIHQYDDWFLINLPGLGSSPDKKIEISIQLPDKEQQKQDYKSLRSAMVKGRYQEKKNREIIEDPIAFYQQDIDEILGSQGINSVEDILSRI
ncbi:MAG: hypothetical protein RBT74_13540 [Tenuifilaceae bacterium]|jgi:hypothetical protein|nr:hypothetical protein [Tenuifilaceae bacterium]